ncbi:hypothetical protein PHMEG_00027108 [Phytophthora megakarya]|uniref:Uncharacterized protein n=1 Tax=Phytophthora megakarya TaxID=4795 RepID=A0A225V9N0_9STRA|nr:hypothetical protein PHMEG_00027108 [Phytophthora megakarya]
MNLSAFAYDIVSSELKYATGGRADYSLLSANGIVTLRSGRTGMDQAVSTKLNSCDCVLQQAMLLQSRHNMCETVLPPYNGFASHWMRRCSVNDIAVGEVSEGCVQMQTLPKMVEPKAPRVTVKYIAAKSFHTNIQICATFPGRYTKGNFQNLRWDSLQTSSQL